jgi:fructan beta-fructosidase
MSGRGLRWVVFAAFSALLAVLGLVVAPAASSDPTLYHEPYRPQFHYTPQQNWMNDPNGPIYYKGKYHLFFQYNPSGSTWGNISWGHAVSPDLVHWTELPLAIPQDDSEYIFSGGVVYDKNDTSGLGTSSDGPLVAIYTSAQKASGIQEQALAYSNDGGLTWTKYAGNPVLNLNSTSFRDPKVFWYAPGNDWVMVVALSDQHKVSIYTSTDLKSWTHQSDFGPAGATGGQWECPNLVPLTVKGTNQTKWVLVVGINPGGYASGSADQYFVGDFDGSTFTSDDPTTYTPPAGTLIGDGGFEGDTYGDWTAAGTAFGSGPAHSDNPTNGAVGHGWVDSYGTGDPDTGTLTSPAFTIAQNYINFLMAGGNHPYVVGGLTSPPAGTTIEDFEGDSLPGWTGTGDFVGITPSKENLPGQLGSGVLDTCQAGCDAAEGTVTSPAFTVNAKYLDVLIAGGNHPLGGAMPTAVAVLVNGQVVASVTGNNSVSLNWQAIDVSAYAGQQAQLEVIDQSDGSNGWGHVIFDNPMLSDVKAVGWANQTGANLIVNGQVVRSATGNSSPDLDWQSWNVSDLKGQQAQVQIVDQNSGGDWGHTIADNFAQSDARALSSIQRAHWVDYGADFYAATSVNDVPKGKQILIGWMNNWNYANDIPTSPWRSADAIPRELGLQKINGHIQLTQQPVSVSSLRAGPPTLIVNKQVTGTVPSAISGPTLDLDAIFKPGSAKQFGFNVHVGNGQLTRIGYDTTTSTVYIDRSGSGNVSFNPSFSGVQSAPLPLDRGLVHLHVLVDTSSVEVFADKGQVVLTDQIFPDPTSNGVSLYANGTATLQLEVGWHLKSIWP